MGRNPVSYEKEMRAEAKSAGEQLFTVDCETKRVRLTYQGHASSDVAEFLMWAGVLVTVQPEHGYTLPDLKRAFRRRVPKDTPNEAH